MDWWCANHWKGMVFVCSWLESFWLSFLPSRSQTREMAESRTVDSHEKLFGASTLRFKSLSAMREFLNIRKVESFSLQKMSGARSHPLLTVGKELFSNGSACDRRSDVEERVWVSSARATAQDGVHWPRRLCAMASHSWRPTATICLLAPLGLGSARTARRRHQRRLEFGAVTEKLSPRVGERNTGLSGRLLI